jgi:hypothetical protein
MAAALHHPPTLFERLTAPVPIRAPPASSSTAQPANPAGGEGGCRPGAPSPTRSHLLKVSVRRPSTRPHREGGLIIRPTRRAPPPSPRVLPRDSVRSTSVGLTRMALRAGNKLAAVATPSSSALTAPSTSGSVGSTSNSRLRNTRVAATDGEQSSGEAEQCWPERVTEDQSRDRHARCTEREANADLVRASRNEI